MQIIFFGSAERDHYYGNQLKAEQEPQRFLSIIIDGMDQAKTNIPHVINMSKVGWKTMLIQLSS